MTRGRYIPLIQREAVFASMMLPEAERDELRARHAMATEVLNRFELHHIQYFAWGAENAWWNLHPMPKAEHRERTRRDIAVIAKSKRIGKKQAAHEFKLTFPEAWRGAAGQGEVGQGMARPGEARHGKARKIPSRPFAKRVK